MKNFYREQITSRYNFISIYISIKPLEVTVKAYIMITYIIQIILFQTLFLAVYDFFLSKETFYKYNRWYLLGTPILSFVLPLIKIPTFQKAMPQEVIIFLPEIVLSPQKVIEQTSFYSSSSINYINLLFWIGVVLFTIVFLIKIFRIVQLISKNEIIQKHFYKLVLLPNQYNAFSFFSYIFLGENIQKEKKETIIEHELIHASQKHSFDLLFFELLRIVMWFNPMIYIYQQRITLLHEYISDAEVLKTTTEKEYYNKLLSETFEVENISFVNQFYKQSFIKKRIIMMTKNKSKQIKKVKYLLLLPLLASMLIYTSCNVEESTNVKSQEVAQLKQTITDLEKQNSIQKEMMSYLLKKSDSLAKITYSKNSNDVSFAVIEEVPIFPGCGEGTRAQKKDCLNSNIKRHVIKNFNADLAKSLDISKGMKKIWVVFRINEKGEVTQINARAPHPKLKEEAERVASSLPKMIPGKQRGKAVGMKYTLPISFVVD